MNDRSLRRDALRAVAAAVAALGGSVALAGWGPRFAPVVVDAWVIRLTPAAVVTWSIRTLGEDGHLLHRGLSVILVLAGTAVVALAGLRAGRQVGAGPAAPLVGGLFVALVTGTLTLAPVPAVAAGAACAFVLAVWSAGGGDVATDRRRALRTLAAAFGVAAVGGYLGRNAADAFEPARLPDQSGIGDALSAADERSLAVPGLEPLVSDEFYRVDVASTPPRVDADDWTLSVTGAVEDPLELSYADLRSLSTERRFLTLRCVGEGLNGRQMDTALWTGTPVRTLLERASPESDCGCVMLRAADGYYEEFPIAALEPGLLAWGMNRTQLPRRHGYPVRALVPGHWGEVNVKWLTEIEVLEREADGFWEKRGWHGTGPVSTVAKLHVVDGLGAGRVRLAGHAYAGTRGVSAVEVSADGGRSWTAARLSNPLPGEDVWRQWVHAVELDAPSEVVVRAVEADGTVQSRENRDPFPSGASGWVRLRVTPDGESSPLAWHTQTEF